ncbi:hypothetical protein J6590_046039 [Homalodisca vitripennis]|nr:hypothetical protein J6590_046039 [Homalodisca vitripennis]
MKASFSLNSRLNVVAYETSLEHRYGNWIFSPLSHNMYVLQVMQFSVEVNRIELNPYFCSAADVLKAPIRLSVRSTRDHCAPSPSLPLTLSLPVFTKFLLDDTTRCIVKLHCYKASEEHCVLLCTRTGMSYGY